ncbi:hypothetical protein V8E51_003716 [Hyaloscypha variabilis]
MVEKDKPWTPRMTWEKVGVGGFGPMPVGTPKQVALLIEKWFADADIDRFNLQCIVELLIHELQKVWQALHRPRGPWWSTSRKHVRMSWAAILRS